MCMHNSLLIHDSALYNDFTVIKNFVCICFFHVIFTVSAKKRSANHKLKSLIQSAIDKAGKEKGTVNAYKFWA